MKSDFSVGANSFALKIRHGFTEDSLKPSSNFISGKTVVEPIINIGVHIVRMNSHLQKTEQRILKTLNFGASGYGGGMINAFIIGEIVYLAENIKKLALII